MAFVTDTRPCANLNALIAGADIAFVEGMFLPRDQRAAREKGHMTVTEAAAAARQNEVKKLVLVHISPRYSDTQRPELEQAARREFPAAMVGKDLQPFNVAQPQETL
jgi:ribonuclease Z